MTLSRLALGVCVVACLTGGGSAAAARRYALLIGNSAYPGAPQEPGVWDRLPNAAHDVELIAKAFWKDGFTDVIVVPDATYQAFNDAVGRFSREVDGADVAVVYYAGHGFEYARKNYLAPIDAPTSVDEADLPKRFIDFEDVATVAAKAKVNIFFLDACRSPVSFVRVSSPKSSLVAEGSTRATSNVAATHRTVSRVATRGLAATEDAAMGFGDIDYPRGAHLAVVYSTARGETALDAAPPPVDYSPFAWEVSRDIVVPKVDLGILFETIREDVIEHTKSSNPGQAPYTYASLGPGFYMNDGEAAPPQIKVSDVQPIQLDPHEMAVTDEPVLIVRVLRDHPAAQVVDLAGRGDPVATYLLGYMYEYGVGVTLDLRQARVWLEKAAASGTPYGELELAAFLRSHPAGAADNARATSLYEAAASQGYAKAQAHLAQFLMAQPWSPSTTANYRRAVDLLRQAARGGYPYAMFAVALRGDPSERPAYLAQLRRIADAGNPDGNEWLCEFAASRGDYSAAVPDCKVAARVGSATAQARLAIAYHNGAGVEKSDDEAAHWAKLALSQTVLDDKLRDSLAFAN